MVSNKDRPKASCGPSQNVRVQRVPDHSDAMFLDTFKAAFGIIKRIAKGLAKKDRGHIQRICDLMSVKAGFFAEPVFSGRYQIGVCNNNWPAALNKGSG